MRNAGADAFLDCIMKRSSYDTLIHMGTILLLVILLPFVTSLYISLNDTILSNETLEALAGARILENLIFNFIVFAIVLSLNKHHRRDILWMEALTEYAHSHGHNTASLTVTCARLRKDRTEAVTKGFLIYLILLTVASVFIGLFISIKELDMEACNWINSFSSMMMLIVLSIATAYQFHTLRRHDSLQNRFIALFKDMMRPDLGNIETHYRRIWSKRVWFHIILMVITGGLYSLFFVFYVVHSMNAHITSQHRFEGKLMRRIMEKEGAVGITKVDIEYDTGILQTIKNFF